jgi:hypothetical protein
MANDLSAYLADATSGEAAPVNAVSEPEKGQRRGFQPALPQEAAGSPVMWFPRGCHLVAGRACVGRVAQFDARQ